MIKISLVHAVCFVWLGKFTAPTDNWRHVARRLYEYELMVVDSGTLYIADEEQQYEVHEGEYLLMRPCAMQHGYKSSDCSFHWLHFIYNEELNKLPGDAIFIPEQGKILHMDRVLRIFSQIYSVFQEYGDRHYASYLVSILLMELVNQQRNEADTVIKQGAISKKVQAYLKWNCYITTKVSDIAKDLGYSEKYISTAFKKETGMTIRQYLDWQLVEQAKEALLNSEQNISQIAYSFGFSDVQNFSRVFKKISGVTPTDFRNQFYIAYEREDETE